MTTQGLTSPKIVIVGGVAGGASAAAKARRTNEHAKIVMFEKGPYVSFANCGLPYYFGGEIEDRNDLLLQTPQSFWDRFQVQVKVNHEVLDINRRAKTVIVKNLETKEIFEEAYDALILAPGAEAVIPPIPGIHARHIFTVKTVPNADDIKTYIEKGAPKEAVVIGAGFIGLESAESLWKKGLHVTLIEKLPQILPPFDPEMASFMAHHIQQKGIDIITGDGIKAFHGKETASEVELESGRRIKTDLSILSIGVRPEIKLARDAGLKIGESGGIAVNDKQETSDPNIYAAGDAAETTHMVIGKTVRIPLAGIANKQGRVAGANAAGGNMSAPGAMGTSIVACLGLVAAKTGLSEKEAKQAGYDFYVSYTHPSDHASYYPGSTTMHIKLVVEKTTGRLLGAQIIGDQGVDKRIDILATVLKFKGTVTDLEQLDLAYAPQFSSAKDPVILAGFVASNILKNDAPVITYSQLQERLSILQPLQLLDVRTKKEFQTGALPQATNIPIDELRDRLKELDPDIETIVYCRVGLRGYLATRLLMQNGFKNVKNLSGGILMKADETTSPTSQGQRASTAGLNPLNLQTILFEKSGVVLDIREEDEFAYEHIEGTQNIPLSKLDTHRNQLPNDQALYVLCQSGVRSEQAVQILKSAGFIKTSAIQGGLNLWKKAGLPTVKSGSPIPIMRQVQIVAGALALLGGAIPGWRWIAAIVGVGLMFAGISGFCGMAVILSKFPWNKRKLPSVIRNDGKSCGPSCG